MTCPHCATLTARIAELEDLLGLQRSATHLHALREAFGGLLPQTLQFVLTLYNAKGRALSYDFLMSAIPPSDPYGDDDRTLNIARTWAYNARGVLGKDAIQTVHDVGYRLTPTGREKVAALLQLPEQQQHHQHHQQQPQYP